MDSLKREWKIAFNEAWEAFKAGSTPIGAALFDENGELVLADHNRANEPETVNRNISHAEANVLRRLDTKRYEPRKLTLFTTMEPCPMCLGTAVMANMKKLRSAAHDRYCGMVYLKDSDPYMKSKGLDYTFADAELEFLQLTIQSYYELSWIERGSSPKVFERFKECCPAADL